MTSRIIETEFDLENYTRFLKSLQRPLTVSVAQGRKRSVEQNRLQRLWINEIAEQLGDQTPEEVRGYCKLRIGVPIMRAENEVFCEKYDRIIKPLPYEAKIEMMMEPLDFPVTRYMTTKQKTAYLDGIHEHFADQGLILTQPDIAA